MPCWLKTRARSWPGNGCGNAIAATAQIPRWICHRVRWASSAPGTAHALADALCAVDDTAGGNEAAHAAGEGRQAAAIRARPAEIAGANHLAVATDIEARRLRREGRSGQPDH